jgi:hypothetical protein
MSMGSEERNRIMDRRLNLAGQNFGKLHVIETTHKNRHGAVMWRCRCLCGAEVTTQAGHLRSGHTKSCRSCSSRRHGYEGTPTYWSWGHLIGRCTNEKNLAYPNYGGRGIRVCERWLQFENFLEDMGEKPSPKHSVDRINNDGNYEPRNCRWATQKQQCRNMRKNKWFTAFGVTLYKFTILAR